MTGFFAGNWSSKQLCVFVTLIVFSVLFSVAMCHAESMTFQCDERANQWDRYVTACPAAGKAYASDGKWRDGIVIDLRGFAYTESLGFPQSKITLYWFDEAGNLKKPQPAYTIDPLGTPYVAIKPDETFQGVLHTEPEFVVQPKRYKILCRVSHRCPGPPYSGDCPNMSLPVQLPEGFDPGKDIYQLRFDEPRMESQWAWAPLEILPAKNRPDPDTSAFRIICPPQGGQCYAGSEFIFDSGGKNRYLAGGGCNLTFKPTIGGNEVTATLKDEAGNPIFNPKGYQLRGKGNMPGEGTWVATFKCYRGKPANLGEFVLKKSPTAAPVTPPQPSSLKVNLSMPKATQEPSFATPEKGAIYAGTEIVTELPADVVYVSSSDQGYPPLSKGISKSYCSLRAFRTADRSVQMLGQDKDYLDGMLFFAGKAAVPTPPIGVRAKLPEDMQPGKYKLELTCPLGRTRDMNAVPLSAQTPQEFEVKARRIPRAVVKYKAAAPTGNKHIDALRRCGPCGGDPYNIVVTGLEKGDQISASWEGRSQFAGTPGSCKMDFPDIAFKCPVSGGSAQFAGKVSRDYDRDSITRHRLLIIVSDKNGSAYTIPGQDITAEPQPKNWEPGTGWPQGEFNFYNFCPGFDNKSKPVITRMDKEVDITGTLSIRAEKFECKLYSSGISIRLKAENPKIDVPLDGAETDTEGALQKQIPLSGMIDPKLVTAPVKATVVLTSYAGREASAPITLIPGISLKVNPEKPPQGDWITVTWKGFQPNASAKLYLDNQVLKENILLDKNDPNISARLPEGLAGKHRIRLVDAVGTAADAMIEIAGTGVENVCNKPCVLAQDKARQGDKIDIRVSAFPRNADVTLSFAGFRIKTIAQASLVDGTPFIVPPGLKDGRYVIEARDIANNVARKEITIAGNMKKPALAAIPVKETDVEVAYRPTIDSVHVKGTGWFVKGKFSAKLIGVDSKKTYQLTGYLDGCKAFVDPNKAYGNPCDTEKGEINLFWPLDAKIPEGKYMLSLSDGLTETTTGNTFKVVSQQIKKPEPPKEVPKKPAPAPAPAPKDQKPKAKTCVPGIPAYQQPGCVPADVEEKKPAPPGKCNPGIPTYMQKGCIPDETPEKKPAAPPGKCIPGVPRYSQPGCIE